ncbi:MAG: hypothetical protein RQ745_00240 [Longimicrobiales bacterium]|nr:hypothetical protein [Longimicrobiales bacterium]
MIFYILTGLAAFGLGIWLGLPGRYDGDLDEIDRVMEEGGRRKKVKRHFTPMAWMKRHVSVNTPSRLGRRFSVRSPDDRD